jgi:glycosyltransferase involved in cell wall biosynthesis
MFSVIIPLYNKELYIQKAIQSVLNQTVSDFEIIVVDNNSTDLSFEKAKSISDPRLKFVSEKTKGVSSARNKGIQEAKFEYICFLDADDFYPFNKLERCLDILERYPNVDMVFHDIVYVDKYGNLLEKSYLERCRLKSRAGNSLATLEANVYTCDCNFYFLISTSRNATILPSSAFIRSSVFGQVGYFSTELKVSEDLDLWLRLLSARVKFYFLDEILSYYRRHGSNLTTTTPPIEKDRIRVHEMNYDRAKTIFSLQQRLVYRKYIAILYANGGFGLSMTKDSQGALQAYLGSLAWSINWVAIKGFIKAIITRLLS